MQTLRTARWIGVLLAVLAIVSVRPASAQAPKVGDYYEDAIDIGFKIKMPDDWEFTPPQPGEDQLIGKYSPTTNKYILLAPNVPLWLEANLVKFDRRSEESGGGQDGAARPKDQRLDKWIERNLRGSKFRVDQEKDRKINKVDATEYLYVGETGGEEFHVYAVLYRVRPDVDVAVVFNGPADRKKWRKYDTAFSKMAKSFKALEVEKIEYSGARDGDSSFRTIKRRQLEEECAKTPGWELYETDNYFVITDNDDRQFIRELMERLEAIRQVYEELYPWEAADRLRAIAAENRKKREAEEDLGDLSPEERAKRQLEKELRKQARSTTTNASPRDLSKCSVVRIFKNKNQYHEYGGPPGSAGYWAAFHEELVIYDDKQGGGRDDTWSVLNHEAFHQYIFYLYGSIAPHSWYNEGTGDYFSGYEYEHKRFKLKPFAWRVQTIKQAIKDDEPGGKRAIVPLKELVRYSQAEYYGRNGYGIGGGHNYAQGWSFIYFLRTAKGETSCWNDDWDGILDTYFETLASTEDLDEAVDVAFAGVDWDAMEECWKQYILKGI